jgi:hypothetical protein
MTSFIVLILILFFSKKQKEGFLNEYCQTYTDCTSCANASGCSWCSATKLCLDSTVLKSTDEKCNQINAINSSFRCKSDQTNPSNPSDSQLDSLFGLYRDKIKNNIPPPNVYTTNEVRYSNEDIISNTNNVRNDIQNLHKGLPGIIASSVENNIKPMVKGILAENYYIQGFEDITGQFKDRMGWEIL